MTSLTPSFLFLCLLAGIAVAQDGPKTDGSSQQTNADLERFSQWFPGEYSNYEQYRQWDYDRKQGKADERFKFIHVHHVFRPVTVEGSPLAYHTRQTMVESGRLFRERVYLVDHDQETDTVRLRIYKLRSKDATKGDATTFSLEQLSHVEGCDVRWRYDAEKARFSGKTGVDTCRIPARGGRGELIVNDALTLTENSISIHDVARTPDGTFVFGHPEQAPYLNRKVRYFTGWVAMKEESANGDEKTVSWRLHRPLRLHDEGGKVSLIDAAGQPMGYRLELARLTRGRTGTKLLKLSLVDEKTQKTKAYSWSDPRSEIMGVNADWIQAGVKLAKADVGFQVKAPEAKPLVETLSAYLEGRFNSAGQAEKNPDFYNISLTTCRVQVPELGAHVLYVEQAATKSLKKPYRQRLYSLSQLADGRVESAIYTFEDPKAWVGTCERPSSISSAMMKYAKKDGCEVKLRFDGKRFRGKTQGKACATTLRGAAYATAEVELHEDGMNALDRGYNADDAQVWGSKAGPYQFERIK